MSNYKKITIKCPNCRGTGSVAVGECCEMCYGTGKIEAEKVMEEGNKHEINRRR